MKDESGPILEIGLWTPPQRSECEHEERIEERRKLREQPPTLSEKPTHEGGAK